MVGKLHKITLGKFFCYDIFVMTLDIYAITDSHQESRNLSRLLSGIYNFEHKNSTPFLILDAGDLFKGIYKKDLSVDAYLKIKELLPLSEIFITLGNNDFGFVKADFEYLLSTIEKFNNAGINVVCANLKNSKTGEFAPWVSRYKIIELDGHKILITGFCLNNSCVKKFGYELLEPEECFAELLGEIEEDYDKIIVLNHHWYPYSLGLKKFAQQKLNKNIDLIIGGHEHSPIKPDFENNIYYPFSFARSLYRMQLDDTIHNVEEIKVENLDFISELEKPIIEYENETQLKKTISHRVFNLTKCYSDPCPLGTFISDNMKEVGKTEIAFHSTGFTMAPLNSQDSDVITNYDIKRVMCANCVLVKIDISVGELKKVFENATQNRMFRDRGNSRFVQCSRNITITGVGDFENKTYKISQIEINGERLLDENSNPIDSTRKFSATIDPYIGSGEQGFTVLQDISKVKVLDNDGHEVRIDELFRYSLELADKNFSTIGEPYPSFKIIDNLNQQ